MRVLLRCWPVLVVSLMVTIRVYAQEPLTLSSAIQCAQAHHPLRQAAQTEVDTAALAWREARIPLSPTVLVTPNSYGTLGVVQLLYIPNRWSERCERGSYLQCCRQIRDGESGGVHD